MSTIRLIEWGSELLGRQLGEGVRQAIVDQIEAGEREVVVDCAGVEHMSLSFADEAFGRLISDASQHGARIAFRNVAPGARSTLRFSLANRRMAVA